MSHGMEAEAVAQTLPLKVLIFGCAVAIASAHPMYAQQLPKNSPQHNLWKIDTGLSPLTRTAKTWSLYGSSKIWDQLQISFRDLSGIKQETEIQKQFEKKHNDVKLLSKFAGDYKKFKTHDYLQRFLSAAIAVSDANEEKLSTYRSSSGDFDFCLAEYAQFLSSLGQELSIQEARLIIIYDGAFFSNTTSSLKLFDQLTAKGFKDRTITLALLPRIFDSFLNSGAYKNRITGLTELAEKLFSERASQKSRLVYALSLFARSRASHSKDLFYKGLAIHKQIIAELRLGDKYDKKAAEADEKNHMAWIAYAKSTFK